MAESHRFQYEVQYVARRDRFTRFEHISHLGGTRSDGSPWQTSYDGALQAVAAGSTSFFVRPQKGSPMALVVGSSDCGRARLCAASDEVVDPLDALPERLPMFGGAELL